MPKKSATTSELDALHRLVAQSFKQRLEEDIKDEVPTDAATLGALIKFLKDNNVTADPADEDDLAELRDKLKQQATDRKARADNVVQLAERDLTDDDYGVMGG